MFLFADDNTGSDYGSCDSKTVPLDEMLYILETNIAIRNGPNKKNFVNEDDEKGLERTLIPSTCLFNSRISLCDKNN